jgi:FAD/FMN-containing dehydrogenase/Fe-S oxidoreductase
MMGGVSSHPPVGLVVDEPAAEVADLLRRVVRGAVSDGARRRVEYGGDAGNYRVLPRVVVEPVDTDDVMAALAVSRETGLPVTARGGGTSIAGNAIGTGIVLDFSRHLNQVLELDPAGGTAVVQPGVVLSDLQRLAAPHGLRFGPDPSSQNRATLGGMIGNNACGPHAVAYGRTADNVLALTAVDGTGRRLSTADRVGAVPGLDALIGRHLDVLRTEFGRFPRQVSGYSLEHLLPERGRNLARALVGSEGTLAVTLDATVSLVPISPARLLVVLGYPDMAAAADAVPSVLAHSPLAVEGLDSRLVDVVRRRKGAAIVPDLPRGAGWLMIEVGGETESAARASAAAVVAGAGALDAAVLPAGPAATAIWRIREDGAGLAGRTPEGSEAWPGWEDAAVPPERLGTYLRDFEALLTGYGLTGIPYGHFGDGCVHVRLDFPLDRDTAAFRQFVLEAARLVVAHGGSCSGEHGDGRARSEVLPAMYSDRALELFGAVKDLFDPQDLLNPGVVVRPRPLDADLRRPLALPVPAAGGFAFAEDGGDFTRAVHRCVGVGKCRADTSAAGGFMCPSYLPTRDEKDVTRGRARVLQELTNGSLVTDWSSREVHESLDLCLSCKACASDCPAGVDMARYKSEVLHRSYRRRLRPVSHYTVGWLPRWLRAVDRLPRVGVRAVNSVLSSGPIARLLFRVAGLDPRRGAPPLAPVSFHRWRRRQGESELVLSGSGLVSPESSQPTSDTAGSDQDGHPAATAPVPQLVSRHEAPAADPVLRQSATASTAPTVVLWVDSFTDSFDPDIAKAALDVLTSAGFTVSVPDRRACCGLSWITTGQLDGARRQLRGLLDVLGPAAAQGLPIAGLEPSCVAALRSDLTDLFPEDARALAVSRSVCTLAELLTGDRRPPGWRPPDLTGTRVLVQPHCHHHSVLGFDADRRLLAATGAEVTALAGCCGLAGNFGMEKGHYDLSVAVAETSLLPALRARSDAAIVLADGFSCRTQAEQLGGVRPLHLAQLLAGASSVASGEASAGGVV